MQGFRFLGQHPQMLHRFTAAKYRPAIFAGKHPLYLHAFSIAAASRETYRAWFDICPGSVTLAP
jgi:hypothetical protein